RSMEDPVPGINGAFLQASRRALFSYWSMNESVSVVAVFEALRDVRVDRDIIRAPRWIGAEAAQSVDSILKGAGGSWNGEVDGYQFRAEALPVLKRVLEGTPRPPGNRVATFQTPEALADRMRDLAAVTMFNYVLEPSAGRGRLIAKLHRQQQIAAIEI